MHPALDLLLPHPATLAADPAEHELGRLYAHPGPTPGRCHVRANMVTTIDGAAWGPDHRSGTINGPADARAFAVQRALADVVLVGAGTVRAEGYTPLEVPPALREMRAQAGRHPRLRLAVVTRSGAVPDVVAADPDTIVVTTTAGALRLAGVPHDRLVVTGADVDLAAALRELAGLGLGRVLTEGGPTLLGTLLDAGLVDELCLTTSPLQVGGAAGRVTGGVGPLVRRQARLAHLLHHSGTLLGRWLLGA